MDASGKARSGRGVGGGSNFCPETCSGEVINDPSVTCFTLKSNLISNLCLTPQVSVLPAGEEGGAGRTSPLRRGAGHQTSWSSSAR